MANIREERVRTIAKLQEENKNLKELISKRIDRTQQFTSLYFVFEGIVFSSLLRSSTISCNLKWIFFTLSLLASIFNFLAAFENVYASLSSYKVIVGNWTKQNTLRQLNVEQPAEQQPGNAELATQQHHAAELAHQPDDAELATQQHHAAELAQQQHATDAESGQQHHPVEQAEQRHHSPNAELGQQHHDADAQPYRSEMLLRYTIGGLTLLLLLVLTGIILYGCHQIKCSH